MHDACDVVKFYYIDFRVNHCDAICSSNSSVYFQIGIIFHPATVYLSSLLSNANLMAMSPLNILGRQTHNCYRDSKRLNIS